MLSLEVRTVTKLLVILLATSSLSSNVLSKVGHNVSHHRVSEYVIALKTLAQYLCNILGCNNARLGVLRRRNWHIT